MTIKDIRNGNVLELHGDASVVDYKTTVLLRLYASEHHRDRNDPNTWTRTDTPIHTITLDRAAVESLAFALNLLLKPDVAYDDWK